MYKFYPISIAAVKGIMTKTTPYTRYPKHNEMRVDRLSSSAITLPVPCLSPPSFKLGEIKGAKILIDRRGFRDSR